MVILCITLSPNDRAQAILQEIGTTINPTPVTENGIVVVVAPILTTVSTDSNLVVSVLLFLFPFFDL